MTKIINLKEKREQIAKENYMGFVQDLLAAGKTMRPSNPYSWVADKLEEASEWGKKRMGIHFQKRNVIPRN